MSLQTLFAASQDASVQLDLSTVFNVKAASTGFDDPLANFDGNGKSYPVEWLPAGDSYNYSGVQACCCYLARLLGIHVVKLQFALPPFHDPKLYDSVGGESQVLSVPEGSYQSFHSLIAWTGSGAEATEIKFGFEDGTSETAGIIVGSWWAQNPFDGPIHTYVNHDNMCTEGSNASAVLTTTNPRPKTITLLQSNTLPAGFPTTRN